LVVAKVRERLAVSKRAAQKIDAERLISRCYTRGMLKNSIKLQPEKVAALANLEDSADMGQY
jgi:hypothetical protein